MKKIITCIAFLTILQFATTIHADEASHKQSAMKFIKMSMESLDFEKMQVDMVQQTFAATMQSLPESKNKAKIIEVIEKVMIKVIKKWSPKLESETIKITSNLYQKNFSEVELLALIDLFETEIGKKYLSKQQLLATQAAAKILPQTMGMVQELQSEIPKALGAAGLK